MRTITGIGPQTTAVLAALLSRFEFANSDALVAYSGLDPRPNDSGTKRGRRRLSKKGPALLRRQMYLTGMSASHSKALKPLYQSIRAKGFATTEAFVILGRKLLRVAFAVWKGSEIFDPTRLMPKT
ncbi:MAG: IS110 family transposase, partial [Comamonadaceae bacterium]|nr:IS110 family transposase [Comamonadaceae bacterium]